ncbi:MAG: hypothetical protein KBC84_07495 [Proteobacteria bacterium]|nr:hypothetical protein [Pseudomonadota bacterium]
MQKKEYNLFPLVSFFWASAIIFHLLSCTWMSYNTSINFSIIGPLEVFLFFTCLFQIYKPSSLKTFLLIALLQVLDFWLNLPNVPNHRLIFALLNISFLLVYLKNRKISSKDFFHAISPYLRITTLILYFFATFHKLNSDFFNPENSCCLVFYNHILDSISFFPKGDIVYFLLPIITIITEAALPIMLFFKRSRNIAILLGLVFHFFLALDLSKHFFDFSSTVFALYLGFFDESQIERLSLRIRKIIQLKYFNYAIILLAAISFSFLMTVNSELTAHIYYVSRAFLWWTYSLTIIFIFVLSSSRNWQGNSLELFSNFKFNYFIFSLIILLNGFSPYLGLKTRTAFDMYSNLQISDKSSNHFVIPFSFDILGYQSDVVQILETDNNTLNNEYLNNNLGITFYELRKILSESPSTRIKYLRLNQVYDYAKAEENPELVKKLSYLQRKLIAFRPVDLKTPSRCIW